MGIAKLKLDETYMAYQLFEECYTMSTQLYQQEEDNEEVRQNFFAVSNMIIMLSNKFGDFYVEEDLEQALSFYHRNIYVRSKAAEKKTDIEEWNDFIFYSLKIADLQKITNPQKAFDMCNNVYKLAHDILKMHDELKQWEVALRICDKLLEFCEEFTIENALEAFTKDKAFIQDRIKQISE